MKKILVINGSLRSNSSNGVVLQAIKNMLPAEASCFEYRGLGVLPHFDDAGTAPPEVVAWLKHLQEADAVIVCSPEYAFGVPGSLKNAFDWTVGSGELVNKPLALVTAATGGDKAHAAWLTIFQALSARIPENCAVWIPFVRSKIDQEGNITDMDTRNVLKQMVASLLSAEL